jgi:hypothetical protein
MFFLQHLLMVLIEINKFIQLYFILQVTGYFKLFLVPYIYLYLYMC